MPEQAKSLISIVIVSLDGEQRLPLCLAALRRTDWPALEVIVVDNGSRDRTSVVVAEQLPAATCLRAGRNLGFAGGNNLGIAAAKGDVIVLLNDDTEPRPDWLAQWMAAAAQLPDWGVLGCKLLYPGGNIIQHAGALMEPNGLTKHIGYQQEDRGQFDRVQPCDYVTGAAFAIKRAVLERIGLLDEKYFPIYFEENDYCARARRAGFGVYCVPRAVVVHHESLTTKKLSFGFLCMYHRNRLRFILKNFDAPQIRRALKRELSWLVRHHPWDCAIPLLRAYGFALLHCVELWNSRKANLRKI